MRIGPRLASLLLLCLVLVMATAGVLGCSSGPASSTTAVSAAPSPTFVPTPGATATTAAAETTTPPVTLSATDKELAKTATVVKNYQSYLAEQGAGQNDPRGAVIYGLRARVQAFSCLKALASNDLENARSAMRDVYSTLNVGRNMAQGDISTVLEQAYASIKTLGDPSNDPAKAKTMLDQFVSALVPLLDQAQQILSSTTTTTTTGSTTG